MRADRCNSMLHRDLQLQAKKHQGVLRIVAQPIYPWSISASTVVIRPESDGNRDNRNDDNHTASMKLWHDRLGHTYFGGIKKLLRSGTVTGASFADKPSGRSTCGTCMKGKQTRKTLRKNNYRSKERCAVIHTDVCGPMSVRSFSGCSYFVSFIGEYSGFLIVVPIASKSDVLFQFKLFQAWLERRFRCSVKRVHSDNGCEYLALREYLAGQGIEQSKSPPYSPNLNGIA